LTFIFGKERESFHRSRGLILVLPEEAEKPPSRCLEEMPEYFNGEVVRLDGCWT